MMEILEGRAISRGIAIGTLFFYSRNAKQVKRCKVENPEAELARYDQAVGRAVEELEELYQKALKEVGAVHAEIFQAHILMLEDEDYRDTVKNRILSQKVNAEYAVAAAGDQFANLFRQMEDAYFQARAADVLDVTERVVALLLGEREVKMLPEFPCILAAEDLAPSETVQMDKSRLLGFITRAGSGNSHTAILARNMELPAISGIPVSPEWNGKTAVVDGETGRLLLDPDPETLQKMKEKQKQQHRQKELLQKYRGKESVTASGKRIHLYANVGELTDLLSVLENDAEGIGLFRSEFLYLEKKQFPTEEEQFQAYKTVGETMAGKKVIIRTLDIGADKQADYFNLKQEENPAMGYRGIRICLEQPEIFKTQLRAIFRAGVYGNLSVMYPMITSLWEVQQIKQIVREVQKELEDAGIPWKELEQGIMIETPAAALISEELAGEVDFFSLGTNDLTQYILAVDRQNECLERFYDPYHPALLRLISQVTENGHRGGCWVGICGELAGDLSMTETFVRMGIDDLSVSPSMVLPVRKQISEME